MQNTYPENYNCFIWSFQTFLKNVEIVFKLPNKNKEYSERILDLCDAMFDKKIYDIGHRAKVEIQQATQTQNNGRDSLINTIKNDCDKLKQIADNLFKTYLKKPEIFKVSKTYFETMDTFYDFHKWFKENCIDAQIIKSNNASNNGENKINHISKIQLANTPFHTQDELDVFECLNSKWNYKDKARWTYIFEFLKYDLKFKISQLKFFTFISENFEEVSKRKQETANDKALDNALKKIHSENCNKVAIKLQ